MPVPSISGYHRLTTTHKFSAVGVAAAGAAALAFAVVPGHAEDASHRALAAHPAASLAGGVEQTDLTRQADLVSQQAKDATVAKQAAADKAATARKQALADAVAKARAAKDAQVAKEHAAKEAANRSTARKPVARAAGHPKAAPAAPSYPDNLDGWIRESLAIMKAKGIPGSYEGIHRNIMRESSGNTRAINNWDINAANGIPSKGLLQVIDPTFKAYHVEGTSWDIYNPVSNITAACNYAAHRYGSMDNVDSAY